MYNKRENPNLITRRVFYTRINTATFVGLKHKALHPSIVLEKSIIIKQ